MVAISISASVCFAEMVECELKTLHTCYVERCKSDDFSGDKLVLRFDPTASQVEVCGGANRLATDCMTEVISWIDQPPRIGVIQKKPVDGSTVATEIVSYDTLSKPNVGMIILPAWGGLGVHAGFCKRLR
jgi:hypothetical protein